MRLLPVRCASINIYRLAIKSNMILLCAQPVWKMKKKCIDTSPCRWCDGIAVVSTSICILYGLDFCEKLKLMWPYNIVYAMCTFRPFRIFCLNIQCDFQRADRPRRYRGRSLSGTLIILMFTYYSEYLKKTNRWIL